MTNHKAAVQDRMNFRRAMHDVHQMPSSTNIEIYHTHHSASLLGFLDLFSKQFTLHESSKNLYRKYTCLNIIRSCSTKHLAQPRLRHGRRFCKNYTPTISRLGHELNMAHIRLDAGISQMGSEVNSYDHHNKRDHDKRQEINHGPTTS